MNSLYRRSLAAFLPTLWEYLSSVAPPVLVVIATIGVAFATRAILRKATTERGGLPYRRQIATVLVVLAGVFFTVISLPIASEIRAQILSVLGLLLSAIIALSSTSFVGNAMAGLMLRLNRSFRPGNFVTIGEIAGRVSEQGLFHTEVQTITRDIVALPNLYVIQHPIKVTRQSGTFISVPVTLGYEVSRSAVESALTEAAESVDLEEPFVLLEALHDHAVEYRAFGLLKDTSKLLTMASTFRRAVVDGLHAQGIEIVSPSFLNRREYPTDHRFAPPREEAAAEAPGEQPEPDTEKIAFDRAIEAESIERLRARRETLAEEKNELAEQAKDEDDPKRRARLKEQVEAQEHKLQRLSELIDTRQQEREEREQAEARGESE